MRRRGRYAVYGEETEIRRDALGRDEDRVGDGRRHRARQILDQPDDRDRADAFAAVVVDRSRRRVEAERELLGRAGPASCADAGDLRLELVPVRTV